MRESFVGNLDLQIDREDLGIKYEGYVVESAIVRVSNNDYVACTSIYIYT